MEVYAVQTKLFREGDDLVDFILDQVKDDFEEGTLLLVTSKIVSLAEGRLLKNTGQDKEELIKNQSDQFLGRIGYDCFLTIKEGLLIPSAGIDESNSESGDYILFPEDPYKSAELICKKIKEKLKLKDFGVIITDSHTTPLRKGVLGVALSYWGFQGVYSQVDKEDLFGRKLKMTQQNLVDALAVSGVMLMGEGAESKPLAVIKAAPVQFNEEERRGEISISYQEDLYYPLYEALLKPR